MTKPAYMQIAADAVRAEALSRMPSRPLSPIEADGRFVTVNGDQLIGKLRAHVDEVLGELCDGISHREL